MINFRKLAGSGKPIKFNIYLPLFGAELFNFKNEGSGGFHVLVSCYGIRQRHRRRHVNSKGKLFDT
jgi:hypothetical protein